MFSYDNRWHPCISSYSRQVRRKLYNQTLEKIKANFSLDIQTKQKWDYINPLTLRPAKTGLTNLEIYYLQKHFLETYEGEMIIRSQTTTLLQIFCELSLCSQVIFKSMKVANVRFWWSLKCEWVKMVFVVIDSPLILVCLYYCVCYNFSSFLIVILFLFVIYGMH